MRGVVAKRLRQCAQQNTIGESQKSTRREYKMFKRAYKEVKKDYGHAARFYCHPEYYEAPLR